MGRHAAERPSLVARTFPKTHSFLAAKQSSLLPRVGARVVRAGWGFLAVSALSLVSVVDPYSGTLASAATFSMYDPSSKDPDQSYGLASTQTISFARGGFNIVTKGDVQPLFVENAELPSPGTSKEYALKTILDMGWESDQYSCLVILWERESNWRVNAKNKSSGAYGIPQSLPGSKMASEGADWMTNPKTQINWGLKYIKGRYGAPCGALAHSNKFNWY
ncbi:MAG: hypothetical protein RLZZ345_517 [Actinomycetota bacterium]